MASADDYAAWIVNNADKRGTPEFDTVTRAYLDARKQATQPEAAPGEREKSLPRAALDMAASTAGAIGRGLRDPIDAGAQLLVRGARAVGLTDDAEVARVDEINRAAEQAYRQGQAARGVNPDAFSPGRMVGNVAATTAAMPFRAAPTMLGRAAQGAGVGAVGGALTPVANTEDFASQKAKQIATGAAVGAVAAPAVEGLVRLGSAVVDRARTALGAAQAARVTPERIEAILQQTADQQGIRWANVADDVRNALREDVRQALQTGGNLNPQQLGRLADIRAVGATPTRGAVTLDPVQITSERNLAKMGAANPSAPAELQQLARTEGQNNAALIARINQLRGPSTADEFSAGEQAIRALRGRDEQAGRTVTGLYDQARALNGGEIPLNGTQFVNQASRALDADFRGAFLPEQIRTVMQRIASGEMPLNVSTAEQLRTLLATAQRSTQDGNARHALGLVRNALEATEPLQSASRAVGPPIPGGQQATTATAEEVTAAFNRARNAHAARMAAREESPALAAAVDGAEPDRFLRQFVIGGSSTAADVNALRRSVAGDQEALDSLRGQIVNHLKTKALSGRADEVGAFSGSAFNRALSEIGDRKLAAFFSPEEIAQLHQVGRAANYLQVQPKGSAVNNSNTSAAAMAILDRVAQRLPFGRQAVVEPINALMQGRQATNALRNPLPAGAADPVAEEAIRQWLPLTVRGGGALGITAAQR